MARGIHACEIDIDVKCGDLASRRAYSRSRRCRVCDCYEVERNGELNISCTQRLDLACADWEVVIDGPALANDRLGPRRTSEIYALPCIFLVGHCGRASRRHDFHRHKHLMRMLIEPRQAIFCTLVTMFPGMNGEAS